MGLTDRERLARTLTERWMRRRRAWEGYGGDGFVEIEAPWPEV